MKPRITIEGEVFRRACVRAMAADASVGMVLAKHLAAYADGADLTAETKDEEERRREAIQRLVHFSETLRPVTASPGSGGPLRNRSWKRDDLYPR